MAYKEAKLSYEKPTERQVELMEQESRLNLALQGWYDRDNDGLGPGNRSAAQNAMRVIQQMAK